MGLTCDELMVRASRAIPVTALLAVLVWGCGMKPLASPTGSPSREVPTAGGAVRIDATRATWRKEKAAILDAVKTCKVTPVDAIRQLEQRRAELAPSVKDGKPIGFSRAKVKQLAGQGKCASA